MQNHPAHADRPAQRVALLGCGTIGTEVAKQLLTSADELAARIGAPVELVGIAVRDLRRPRDPAIPAELLTADAESLIDTADIVVEATGTVEPARTLILRALNRGAAVVTANKALLAKEGPALFEAADRAGTELGLEAAVAGAVPIVRSMRESLAGDTVTRLLGIVNGTTNYVLDLMTHDGGEYADALYQARQFGYTEPDPTADVEGYDAAAKAAILASLAFHSRLSLDDVYCEGITGITAADVAAAASTGHVIKLLAIAERVRNGEGQDHGVLVRVHPALIPAGHPLASVHGNFNAIFVEAAAAGDLMFYGQGTGALPTASAILGDLVSIARNRVHGGRGPGESSYAALPALPVGLAITRYQIRLRVLDRPGVLASVAQAFAAMSVSLDTVRQVHLPADEASQSDDADLAELLIVTHQATEAALRRTVEAVSELAVVRSVTGVIRVEGD